MKRAMLITLAAFAVLAGLWLFYRPTPTRTTTWQNVDDRMPAVAAAAGFQIEESRSRGADEVALPWTFQVREWLRLKPRSRVVSGFPNSVSSYLMASTGSGARVECLVRYADGKAAVMVVRFPAPAREETRRFREALRREFPGVMMVEEENR